MYQACSNLNNIEELVFDNLSTKDVYNMRKMFTNCPKLKSIKGLIFDVSHILSNYDMSDSEIQDSVNNHISDMFKGTPLITDITIHKGAFKRAPEFITSQLLKGDDTLTIHWVD